MLELMVQHGYQDSPVYFCLFIYLSFKCGYLKLIIFSLSHHSQNNCDPKHNANPPTDTTWTNTHTQRCPSLTSGSVCITGNATDSDIFPSCISVSASTFMLTISWVSSDDVRHASLHESSVSSSTFTLTPSSAFTQTPSCASSGVRYVSLYEPCSSVSSSTFTLTNSCATMDDARHVSLYEPHSSVSSSAFILTTLWASSDEMRHVLLHEPCPPSGKPTQFCKKTPHT